MVRHTARRRVAHDGGVDTWRLGRRPALDGLRGVAILLVVACHAGRGLTGAGIEGVMVFFVLSGFLITSLLLEEHAHSPISLRAFYLRRARRLFPALAVVVVLVLVLGLWLETGVGGGDLVSIVFYVSNWYQVGHPTINALSQTWSLAIEEQFYLVWPVVLIAAMRGGRRRLQRVAVMGAAGSFLLMAWGVASGHEVALARLDVGAPALMTGCALAAWMHSREEGGGSNLLATLGLLALVPLAIAWPGWGARLALQIVTPMATAVVIWSSVQRVEVRLLCTRWLRWVGQRSYAIYLWHFPILWIGERYFRGALPVAVEVMCAFALAELSWRFVESPVMRSARDADRLVAAPGQVPVARDPHVERARLTSRLTSMRGRRGTADAQPLLRSPDTSEDWLTPGT